MSTKSLIKTIKSIKNMAKYETQRLEKHVQRKLKYSHLIARGIKTTAPSRPSALC